MSTKYFETECTVIFRQEHGRKYVRISPKVCPLAYVDIPLRLPVMFAGHAVSIEAVIAAWDTRLEVIP